MSPNHHGQGGGGGCGGGRNRSDFELSWSGSAFMGHCWKIRQQVEVANACVKNKRTCLFMLFAFYIKHHTLVRIRCLKKHLNTTHKTYSSSCKSSCSYAGATHVTFLGGCYGRNARSCFGRVKPVNCQFLGRFYFHAAVLPAGNSKRACQTITCKARGSGASVLETVVVGSKC